MRHVSRTHRVALDSLFDRINLDPKIPIKYIDTKNQLADMLTKGNFTRDEWNHLLCLFNISHFSSTDCSEVMSKRTQKDSGEERVTAKSKPMMNLVSRCSGTTPDVLPHQKARWKPRHESQFPLSSRTEQHHRTGRPVKDAHSSSYSEWNVDKTWSSQEWKSDELMVDRTGRPVVFAQHTDKFSEMSLESRSFLHRVNDQVRKKQNQSSKDATKDSDKHSVIRWMFMSSTLQASVFMGKNYSDNVHSIKNKEDLTIKQMFDISEKLTTEQSDEIYRVNTINWEDSSWKYLSLVGDEEVMSLLHTKVYVFSDSVICLGKMNENPQSHYAWEDRLTWCKSSPEYRALDKVDGEPMEFEWNIFTGFTTLQLCHKVQELRSKLSVQPENFTGRIIFMSMLNDISWGSKDNEKECESSAQLVSLYAKRFFTRTNGHSSDLDQKRNGIQLTNTNHKENGTEWQRADDDKIRCKHTPSLPVHESIIQRSAEEQRRWKIVNTLLCRRGDGWIDSSHNYFC